MAGNTAERDPKLTGVYETLRTLVGNIGGSLFGLSSDDPFQGANRRALGLTDQTDIQVGVVTQCLPWLHWHRVKLAGQKGVIGCCSTIPSGLLPISPNHSSLYQAGSIVLVLRSSQLPDFGVILGAIPTPMLDVNTMMSDQVQQGSTTGIRREPAHNSVLDLLYREGGVADFSSGRTADATTLDAINISSVMGLMFHMDPFQTFLRVSEICGIFFNYFDEHMRLVARNYDFQSPAFCEEIRNDEGEASIFRGETPYVHEALGVIDPAAEDTLKENDDEEIQYKSRRGKIDLPDDHDDRESFWRWQQWGGYLGQALKQLLVCPTKPEINLRGSPTPAVGLYDHQVSLDGAEYTRVAKRWFVVKSCMIPLITRKRKAEDGRKDEADDREQKNYRFAGLGEDGDEHKVGDVKLDETKYKGPALMAGVPDLVAYDQNFKGQHPFHYHKKDFKVSDPPVTGSSSSEAPFKRSQVKLEYDTLLGDPYGLRPDPVKVKIDDRYGETEFFETESMLGLLDDGNYLMRDGYGSAVQTVGGHMTLSTPGDLTLAPGGKLIILAGTQVIIKARKAADITVTDGDARIFAKKNLQVCSSEGGILIESQGGDAPDFLEKVGADVVSSGVTVKSTKRPFAAYAAGVYLRTGGGDTGDGVVTAGPIVLDADRGKEDIVTTSKGFIRNASNDSGFQDVFIVNERPVAVNYFKESGGSFASGLNIGGNVNIYGNGGPAGLTPASLTVSGDVAAPEGIIYGTNPQVKPGGDKEALRRAHSEGQTVQTDAGTYFTARMSRGVYGDSGIGNDKLIVSAGFSFRDDEKLVQYASKNFAMLEAPWQQMVRLGLATGGEAWKETSVRYQGKELYPYPGKKWLDPDSGSPGGGGLLCLEDYTLVDPKTGSPKPRSDEAYQDPKIKSLQSRSMSEYLVQKAEAPSSSTEEETADVQGGNDDGSTD